ncbi:RNA helicase [Clostridium zeae]|uniref:RNA helicase n=1 Tax=Clostridium zeae TaxID=2759022 RepID=A0ABQ1EH93_9CLOT|nr:DEAD/DEAH box helicase [Clostridium zeae]GFZ34192.1 RNA helicase [Clostridium zeae]
MEKMIFNELNCSDDIKKAISDMGFTEATPIQALAIPVVMSGADMVGQAQTGTGKTAAFGIPTIDRIDTSSKDLQVLVLCPTRELAVQVGEEFEKLAKYKRGLNVLAVYGGDSMERQIRGLRRGSQIVVGTPGRVMDHMRRGTIKMDSLKVLILDEADEMLNMGFREDIEEILSTIEQPVQKLLFSATMKRSILDIVKKHLKNPEMVKIENKEVTTPNIAQMYVEVKEQDKVEVMTRLIDMYNPKLSLIFCNTKSKVDEIEEKLLNKGYNISKIHGDMKQSVRSSVIQRFKQGNIKILIATDVAARGLDIDDVEMVFNFDVPQHEEHYVHRIGRTGRAGREGRAFTMVTGRQMRDLRDIMTYTKKKMKLHNIPTLKDVRKVKIQKFVDMLQEDMKNDEYKKYVAIVEKMLEQGHDAKDVAAALLQRELNFTERDDVDMNPAASSRDESTRRSGRNDRSDRSDRGGREGGQSREEGMVRMFVNIGRDKNLKPEHLVRAIASEVGIPGRSIGAIDIYEKYTFVEVPEQYSNDVLDVMNKVKINGVRVNVEVAQKKGTKKRRDFS